jgi:predicted N-acetyltransferase YhbS
MRFRDAREEDFEACQALLRQLWPTPGVAGSEEQRRSAEIRAAFCRLLASPDARVVVAEEDGQVVALLDVSFRETLFFGGPAMIIEDLIVDEAHRRQGIGGRLVQLAEDVARRRGCRGIELSSDLPREETHQFWEGLGYRRLAYQFRKQLSQ